MCDRFSAGASCLGFRHIASWNCAAIVTWPTTMVIVKLTLRNKVGVCNPVHLVAMSSLAVSHDQCGRVEGEPRRHGCSVLLSFRTGFWTPHTYGG